MGELIQFPGRREPWVSLKVLAQHFSVSETTVKRWRVQGLPCMKVGRSVRFRVSEAEAWVQAKDLGIA